MAPHRRGFMATLICGVVFLATEWPLADGQDLANRCKYLSEATLKQYCSGKYPFELSIKYRDKLIDQGMPYAVYRVENENSRYFVSFRLSELHACKNLQHKNTDPRIFTCADGKTPSNITLLEASIHCFEFNVQLNDELVSICLEQNGRKEPLVRSTLAALHYTTLTTLEDDGNGATATGASSWLFCSAILPVFLYLK